MKKSKMENAKAQNQKTTVAIVFGILILSVFIIGLSYKNPFVTKQADNEGQKYDNDFFAGNEQCRCIERNQKACSLSGFEYNETRNLCVNYREKKVTYSVLKCSKYECSGEIYNFNNKKNTWKKE